MALSARSVERASALAVVVLFFGACTPAASAPAPAHEPPREPSPPAHEPTACESPLRAILDEPDRGTDDRALDRGRRPIELFELAGVRPGMRVAEIGAWKGYTAELLARAVAPEGSVYAVDPPELDKETRSAWEERRKRPASRRITRLARAYQDPFPPETPPLDAVFNVLFYHDMVWLGVDRPRMNAAIFRALKPGGVLVLADHSAKAGDGIGVARSLHRIEESVVKAELLRAGFVLDREADFLRHPEDARDWSASDEAPKEKRGTSDRFVLRFRKPVPPAPAAPVFTHDPDAAELVTSDIDHFWSAFDHAGPNDALSVFQKEYLDNGSPGLKDFVALRVGSAALLANWVARHPAYYASIRRSTGRVASFSAQIHKSFRQLHDLYADAVFPNVYFVVGRMTSGGTVSPNGLLIGAEMYGLTPHMPTSELSSWHKQVIQSVDVLPGIVAHELIHFEQKESDQKTLLAASIREGSADFIGELISGMNTNKHLRGYGLAHERELWAEMSRSLHGTDHSRWLYNGDSSRDRPADLGYFVGARIASAYYDRAADKKQAIRDILEVTDYDAFLAKSGYAEQWR